MNKSDFLICGGGIIGLTIAKELLERGYDNILIIEKENVVGKHASGRNSGVLHAGIYYTPDSLRAKSCLHGNFLMKQYCREKGLPLLETGKVIVTKNEDEVETLKELYSRAVKNGARVEIIDEKQLSKIEPYAKTLGMALYSYDTAVVDPEGILKSLYNELINSKKIKIITNTTFLGIKGSDTAITNNGEIKFGTFINASGSYSDKVAHKFSIGLKYSIVPFKGIYKKLKKEKSYMVKSNIYPAPDIRNPFLGVHFTRSINGEVYIGPTAIPAFGRENYGLFTGLDREALNILYKNMALFWSNARFRNIALTEPRKYLFKFFYKDAKDLVKGLDPDDLEKSDKVGIRPQLIDWEKRGLVMDFLVIKNGNSIHILNTISPAFTSSMDFAAFIVKNYISKTIV